MLPHHYLDAPIDATGESISYLSRNPDGRVIVFVHGFMGDKFATWHKMHEELVREPTAAGTDLIFYGYASVQPQALASAGLLRQFLHELVTLTPSVKARMHPARQSLAGFSYSKIIIVAHSLGAAITRRALLDLHKGGATWTNYVSLLLFAPAHRGAQLAELRKELVHQSGSSIISLISAFFSLRSQASRDLERKSVFIRQLKSETAAALTNGSATCLKARKVIFGQKDSVVLIERFCDDPCEAIWHGHNHTSVCKASPQFTDPLREVLNQL
jgi:pimeloyl-ACP methyl ester carboxylesterase